MTRLLVCGALVLLSGCGNPGAVGANSADSVTTTAVGNIVGTLPSPTPTPVVADNSTMPVDASAINYAGENSTTAM